PKCGLSIAAVLDEGEPFGIGDLAVGETKRMDQLAMARRFIVPGEAFSGVTDLMNAASKCDPGQRLRIALLRTRTRRPVGGPQRICGEERENVGEDQLLMLLLMIDADLNDPRQLRSGFNAARKQLFEPGVHMGAVGENAIAGRPREEPAHSPRLAGSVRFIIGVEAIVEGRIEQVIVLKIQGENESLEEPGC